MEECNEFKISEIVPYLRESCQRQKPSKKVQKIFGTEKKSFFPTGRKPWTLVYGLDYDVDLDGLDCLEVLDVDFIEEEEEGMKLETQKRRTEKYEFNSFCCQDGYLSEEEYFESPSATREEKRQQVIKMREASERKKRKSKLQMLTEPEILTSNNAKTTVKKWNIISFFPSPIPTGISIGRSLLKQATCNIDLGFSKNAEVGNVLPVLPSLQPNPIKGPAGLHLPPDQQVVDNNLVLGTAEHVQKYKTKYMIKEKVFQLALERCSEDDPKKIIDSGSTLEALVASLQKDSDIGLLDQELVSKYACKFFFEFLYRNSNFAV